MAIAIAGLEYPEIQAFPANDFLKIPLSLSSTLGLKPAVIIQKIHGWLGDLQNIITLDGVVYTLKTYNDFKFLPWCIRSIRSAVNKLERLKILVSKAAFDRRAGKKCKLYTIDYTKLEQLSGIKIKASSTDQGTCASSLVHVAKLATSSSEAIVFGDRCMWQNVPHGDSLSPTHTGFPQSFPQDTIIINNIYNNNRGSLELTSDPGDARSVVVFEKAKLLDLKISDAQLRDWVRKRGAEYVDQKIELMKLSNPREPEKFLNAAIKNNWLPASKQSRQPKKPTQETTMSKFTLDPRHAQWFEALAPSDKSRVLEDANFVDPFFTEHLKTQNIDFFSPEFTKHWLFGFMFESLTRGIPNVYNQI